MALLSSIKQEYFKTVGEVDNLLGGHPDLSHLQGCLFDLSVLVLASTVLWLLFRVTKGTTGVLIDAIWPAWPAVLSVLILYRSPMREVSKKQYLFLATVSFWSARSLLSMVTRKSDWKYAQLSGAGKGRLPLSVVWGRSFFIYVVSVSVYAALRNRFSQLEGTDLAGLALMLVGVLVQTHSDEMRSSSEEGSEVVVDAGLWRWCRHPGQFGELVFWLGVWAFAGFDVVGRLSQLVLLISTLLVFVPLVEEHMHRTRGQAYADYRQRVKSSLVPFPFNNKKQQQEVIKKEE